MRATFRKIKADFKKTDDDDDERPSSNGPASGWEMRLVNALQKKEIVESIDMEIEMKRIGLAEHFPVKSWPASGPVRMLSFVSSSFIMYV